jgi:hypothetical protein
MHEKGIFGILVYTAAAAAPPLPVRLLVQIYIVAIFFYFNIISQAYYSQLEATTTHCKSVSNDGRI